MTSSIVAETHTFSQALDCAFQSIRRTIPRVAALNILKKGGGTAFGEALPLGGPENREPHKL